MIKKFWTTTKFKKLQSVWEEKLKGSGFVDVETEDGKLKQNSGNSYRTTNHEIIESKQRYFELLGQGVHEEEFVNEMHRIVMQQRADGIRVKDIARNVGRHTDNIRKILRYYEAKWKITRKV